MIQAAPIPIAQIKPVFNELKPIEVEADEKTDLEVKVEEVKQELLTVPSVLQELAPVDRLLITKQLNVKNVLLLRGKRNTFFVRTTDSKLVYTVQEENSWWSGYFCNGLRSFQLHVNDSQGQEVMRIVRSFACTARVLPCHMQRLHVEAPPGNEIGSVEQQWSPIRPLYLIKDKAGEDLFWIRGPFITVGFFKDKQFQIMKADGTAAGATCKRWQGLIHSLFVAPITDRFGVAFELDLSNEEKALLLAATLLMYFMYYDV